MHQPAARELAGGAPGGRIRDSDLRAVPRMVAPGEAKLQEGARSPGLTSVRRWMLCCFLPQWPGPPLEAPMGLVLSLRGTWEVGPLLREVMLFWASQCRMTYAALDSAPLGALQTHRAAAQLILIL